MSVWELLANLLFSGIGFVAFTYGKKMGQPKPAIIGVGLMCYPWFVSNALWLFVVGTALTALLFVFRD